MAKDYFNPPLVGNHQRPIKSPKHPTANYGQKPTDKRRSRRQFGR